MTSSSSVAKLEKSALAWTAGQTASVLGASVCALQPSSDVQQLGFMVLATTALVCFTQTTLAKREVRAINHTVVTNAGTSEEKHEGAHWAQEQKKNRTRSAVLWGHALVGLGLSTTLVGVINPITIGIVVVSAAALFVNSRDGAKLAHQQDALREKILARRLEAPLSPPSVRP